MGNNTTPKCSCVCCNAIGKYAFPARRRGGNNAYLCSWHMERLHNYTDENNQFVGKSKVNGFTWSRELETMKPSDYAKLELMLQGYLPTSDCTCDIEFKSAIEYGLNIGSAYARTIEFLRNTGEIVLDENVGLHTHCGHALINASTMPYIRRFYHSLFCDVMNEWLNDSDKYTQLFGRRAGCWAEPFTDRNRKACEHKNAINVQHTPTIEFRSPRFQTAEQYIAVMHYIKGFMTILIENYIPALEKAGLIMISSDNNVHAIGNVSEKTESVDWDNYNLGIAALTIEQRNILKTAADKTSTKLVKHWKKFNVSDIHWTGEIGNAYQTRTETF